MNNQYIPKEQKQVKKRRHTKPVVGKEPKEGGGGKPEEDNGAEKDCGPEECGDDYQNGNESEEEGCKPDCQYPSEDDDDDDDKPKPVVKKRRKNSQKNNGGGGGPLNEYSKVSDLREEAKIRGIKYISRMSKEKLCEVLGIGVSGKGKYTLKNINTGEELKFKTIQVTANKFNISKSTVEYNMGGEVTINENTFLSSQQN